MYILFISLQFITFYFNLFLINIPTPLNWSDPHPLPPQKTHSSQDPARDRLKTNALQPRKKKPIPLKHESCFSHLLLVYLFIYMHIFI